MNIKDLLLDDLYEPSFEDEHRLVVEVLGDIGNGNVVTRVSKTIWKTSPNKNPVLDIRKFNKEQNVFYKGISIDLEDIETFKEIIDKI